MLTSHAMIAGCAGRWGRPYSTKNVASPSTVEMASRGRRRIWSTTVFGRLVPGVGSVISPPGRREYQQRRSGARTTARVRIRRQLEEDVGDYGARFSLTETLPQRA